MKRIMCAAVLSAVTALGGCADNGADIGLDSAKTAALGHAGLSAGDVTFVKVELDRDDGTAEYDIEFTADNMKYEYEINAADGRVLKFSSESVKPAAQPGSSVAITEERAKEIAVQHAGYTADKVTFVKIELDRDGGLAEYEIEFRADGKKYEIGINAENGDVIKTEVGG